VTDERRPPSMNVGAAPDDFDHLEYSQLVSLVDGCADEVDREWMLSHIESCDVCREDLDDLSQIRAALLTPPAAAAAAAAVAGPPRRGTPHQRRWLTHAIGIGTVAAGVALAIWIGRREPSSEIAAPAAPPLVSQPATVSAPVIIPSPNPVPAPALSSVLTNDEQGRVSRALASGRMELPPNMAVLRGHTGTLLGAADPKPAFSPTSPVATAVTEPRPQFSWTPRTGATRYTVTVFDERFREVAKSGSLKTTTWTPRQNLPRGHVLAWQVTAVAGDETAISPAPPQPEARFVILDVPMVATLAKERARLATEPVALGLVLAKAGLFAEADAVLQTALTGDRYDRTQVRALLARLRAR
jgi:hypothetical protein